MASFIIAISAVLVIFWLVADLPLKQVALLLVGMLIGGALIWIQRP
jgi:hypothetical protein